MSVDSKPLDYEKYQQMLIEVGLPSDQAFDASLFNVLLYLTSGQALEGKLRIWFNNYIADPDVFGVEKLKRLFNEAEYKSSARKFSEDRNIYNLANVAANLCKIKDPSGAKILLEENQDLLDAASNKEKNVYYEALSRCFHFMHLQDLMVKIKPKKEVFMP